MAILDLLLKSITDPHRALIGVVGGIGFLALSLITISYIRVLLLRARMPPGPFPYPIVGNIGRIPANKPWRTFERWSQEYKNPLITIWTGIRPTVIVNDCWSASELMEKRAHIYSSRPHLVLVGDMLDETTTNQTSLVYGDTWRLHRRIMHNAVGSQAVRGYRTFQANESRIMLRDLLQNDNDYVNAIERYSCSVVTIIGWGRRIDTVDDYLAKMAIAFVQMGANFASPGQHLVESYPWMTKLPARVYPLPSLLWNEGQKLMKFFYALSLEGASANEDNFSKYLIQQQQAHGLNDKEVATLTGNLIGGGVDTTTTSLINFIFAMCAFPHVQTKAQEEIDRVLHGGDGPPGWAEEDSLPYCTALVSEVFRWRAAIVLGGPPHSPIQDDRYNGMLIPKGTTIIGNLWAIHRNPRDYPNPDEFRPERFLDERKPLPTKKGYFTFGWGRRVCSGEPLAEQGIWFTVIQLLWAFKMRSVDEMGADRAVDIFAYNDNAASRPLPFRVEFKPRSTMTEHIIHREAALAREAQRKYDYESKVTMENAQ